MVHESACGRNRSVSLLRESLLHVVMPPSRAERRGEARVGVVSSKVGVVLVELQSVSGEHRRHALSCLRDGRHVRVECMVIIKIRETSRVALSTPFKRERVRVHDWELTLGRSGGRSGEEL